MNTSNANSNDGGSIRLRLNKCHRVYFRTAPLCRRELIGPETEADVTKDYRKMSNVKDCFLFVLYGRLFTSSLIKGDSSTYIIEGSDIFIKLFY